MKKQNLMTSSMQSRRYMPTLLCAAALEAVVSFLATVYMVKKRSMHSFLTATVGTVMNVLLNLLLIPRIGALGAAIATLAAYGAVLAVRLIDAPRLIRFRLYPVRMAISILLLLAAAGVMTLDPVGRIPLTLLLTAATVAINAPALIKSLLGLLRHRRGERGCGE